MGGKSLQSATIVCVIAGVFAIGMPRPTRAQQFSQYLNTSIPGYAVEPGVTVTSRLRPEYAYPGIRFGDILIQPELAEGAGYDSNVSGTRSARGSSFLATQGSVTAASDWARNSIAGALTVDNERYFDLARQSYTDWTARLGGTYDVGAADVMSLDYVHLNLNQTPSELDVPQLDQPIAVQSDDLRGSYKAVFSKFSLQPGVEVAWYNYQNGTVFGVSYPQTYRNRMIVTPGVTASYEFAPQRTVMLVVSDAIAHYTEQQIGQPTRNFNDLSVLAGIDYNTGATIQFHALAGYETRHFTSSQFPAISAPVAELIAIWSPTGLTTVTATAAHYIEDSASETTVGLTSTAVKLAVDHEYLRNVLLNASAGFVADSYAQSQGNQSYLTLGAGVTWLINEHLRLAGRYDFATRTSSVPNATLGANQTLGGNFSDNRFLLQLRVGL